MARCVRRTRFPGKGKVTDVAAVHAPSRPDWSCRACGQEWPCTIRKRQLKYLYQGNPVRLGNQLRSLLDQARDELPALTEEELTERFVTWSDRPVPSPQELGQPQGGQIPS